jgi:hypothetical protein
VFLEVVKSRWVESPRLLQLEVLVLGLRVDFLTGRQAFDGGKGGGGSFRRLCEELIEINAGVSFLEVGDAFGAVWLALFGLHHRRFEPLLEEDVELVGLVCLHKKYYIYSHPSPI